MAVSGSVDDLAYVRMGDWVEAAACKGKPTEWWFPMRGQGHIDTTKQAVAICKACPVRQDCLNYALSHPYQQIAGIWGGATDKDRRMNRYRLIHGLT